MMTLKDIWQQQRQQRQTVVAQRQEAVQAMLITTATQRQVTASQLRSDLSLYRDSLVAADQARRLRQQNFQAGLTQFHADLQTDVQQFLAEVSDRRQSETAQLFNQLDQFVQSLRQQTAQLLQATRAERLAMAEQVRRDLTVFTEALRADVQSYLWEMETLRQQRAIQVNQKLSQGRSERLATMQALRSQLQQFRAALRQTVWGAAPPDSMAQPVVTSAVQPAAKTPSPKPASDPGGSIGAFQYGGSVALVPPKPAMPPQADSATYEQDVYNYIDQIHGARLAEIESSLGINRFQAVDALRSLIKKGMVTQRDRIYLAQTDFART